MQQASEKADIILVGGKVATLDYGHPFAEAVAVKGGRFFAVGSDGEIGDYRGPQTQTIDLDGRTVVPGLGDSHCHFIREGLSYNTEVRWDGVRSLATGIELIRRQVERSPVPQWVRVIGGWSEFQFTEKRTPTPGELTALSASTPILVSHFYHDVILNRAALKAVGVDRNTPSPPGGEVQKDADGEPTGLLIAKPAGAIIYSTIAKAPKLPREDQVNSTLQYMRELNRYGLTSVVDGGGGGQNYPDDYSVIAQLAGEGRLTVRTAYNLFPQRPKHELEDFKLWSGMTRPGVGDAFYRMNGAGETLVASAGDFENFMEPRPNLGPEMEGELKPVVDYLVGERWPFQLHATYDESIDRFLNVFEEVNDRKPFDGLRWFFVHAETISDRNIERVRKLGGGISVQDRMAFQGEYFAERYGDETTGRAPPFARMVQMGIRVGSGSDAPRVSTYNPWVTLYWLVTGRTLGGLQLYPKGNLLSRMEALRLATANNAWFSGEDGVKGSIRAGQLADLAVLSEDYFEVPDEGIKSIESVLTIVSGKVVHAAAGYSRMAPPRIPVSPSWSPLLSAR